MGPVPSESLAGTGDVALPPSLRQSFVYGWHCTNAPTGRSSRPWGGFVGTSMLKCKGLNRYAEGERFTTTVEARGGRTLFDRVWEGAEWLPTLSEIRSPQQWIARAEHLGASN